MYLCRICTSVWCSNDSWILDFLPRSLASQSDKSKSRRVTHLIEVVIFSVCALLPSIVIVGISGYQFIAFPPVCNNEIPDVFCYTLIFPMSTEATVGLCMLLVSLWILHMQGN